MRTSSFHTLGALTAALAFAGAARAQDVILADDSSGWFLRAGAAVRFNLNARVDKIPSAALPSGVYDNGFVLPDSSGTASGKTWNWGYQRSSQIEGDELRFDRLDDLPSDLSAKDDLDPAFGGEFVAGYRFANFEIGKKPARLGLELGYGYAATSLDLSSASSSTARWTTARHGLDGVVPPTAPYSGSPAGPGPLIDLNPGSQTTSFSTASSTLESSLDLDLHNFRVGPVLEVDLSRRLGIAFGLGYSSVYADAELSTTENVRFSNPAFPAYPSLATTKVDLNRGDWRLGFYTELRVSYQFSRLLSAYVGGDYQYNSNLEFGNDSRQVEIGLEGTYAAKAGLLLSF